MAGLARRLDGPDDGPATYSYSYDATYDYDASNDPASDSSISSSQRTGAQGAGRDGESYDYSTYSYEPPKKAATTSHNAANSMMSRAPVGPMKSDLTHPQQLGNIPSAPAHATPTSSGSASLMPIFAGLIFACILYPICELLVVEPSSERCALVTFCRLIICNT